MALLNPNPPKFPADWAISYGEDRFGLWQAFGLNGVRQVMRWIPPGRFMMGSRQNEEGRNSNETRHAVLISQGFYLADTACTQALWLAAMGTNPSRFKDRPEHPIERVSWNDCQEFIAKANALLQGRLTLRLPSESEWEYAARAGSDTAFWWGDGITPEQANYNGEVTYNNGIKGEYRQQTVDVLQFEVNDFGLFNVHGNVREWCQDWHGKYPQDTVIDPQGPEQGQRRVLRGGSWIGHPQNLRAAYRSTQRPDSRYDGLGLRLAGG